MQPVQNAAEALVYAAPGLARIERVELAPMAPGLVEVRTSFSALSRGTERLVFEGRVPESEHARMRAPFQAGDFPFPVRYGYAAAGTVEEGPHQLAELIGREVFALHPHQTRFRLPADALVPLPDGVPPERAVLAANMETALNALWDAVARAGRPHPCRRRRPARLADRGAALGPHRPLGRGHRSAGRGWRSRRAPSACRSWRRPRWRPAPTISPSTPRPAPPGCRRRSMRWHSRGASSSSAGSATGRCRCCSAALSTPTG